MNIDMATDYCDFWPDFIQAVSIKGCCHLHDVAYWNGGTVLERLAADVALADCVTLTLATSGVTWAAAVGGLMLLGTRALGWIFWPKVKRDPPTD